MIREHGIHDAGVGDVEGVRAQDMVDAAPRPPGGEGGQQAVVDAQARGGQGRVGDEFAGGAVGVAHEDDVFVVGDEIADGGQLLGAAGGPQRQVGDDDGEGVGRGAEAGDERTTTGHAAGEFVFFDVERFVAADQPQAVLGHAAHVAIDLDIPVGQAGLTGHGLDLVLVARAPAAGIDFLQAYNVVVGDQAADAVQVVAYALAGQQMTPAAGEIFAIAAGADADLHVETQHPQGRVVLGVGHSGVSGQQNCIRRVRRIGVFVAGPRSVL